MSPLIFLPNFLTDYVTGSLAFGSRWSIASLSGTYTAMEQSYVRIMDKVLITNEFNVFPSRKVSFEKISILQMSELLSIRSF